MANHRLLIPFILKWEGGWSDDPDDRGGLTNKGITLSTYSTYKGRNATPYELRRITRAEWEDIFKKMYWDKIGGDAIKSQSVADILADWAWMSGHYNAVRTVQAVLGVRADGIVGMQTLRAINTAKPKVLFNQIKEARENYYYRIVQTRPQNRKFLRGWLNRLNDMEYEN